MNNSRIKINNKIYFNKILILNRCKINNMFLINSNHFYKIMNQTKVWL